ncbi:cysteine desulfurase sulfur acceptor subunit CsdE [Vibrio sp.]|uniref:Cysteine desulfurase sulfur acceptor subunit CsdE n=1 Tax=Vibrio viridaestus TaxID=2487322 RepID=A0A3N9TFL9_9VIBR|nr:cysteine desulfurase sulfur acceptor subunit CsdE [Vibrio viridaestus]MDC0609370.1 cysteine desulfurase sulfur acceptor subunit CsdE [Vibrio sp.]RQW63047.1 cysteine desulfurase sulfur acceptor subunit CsdE [Vibrio viridaestus]
MSIFPEIPFGKTIDSENVMQIMADKTTWEDRYRQLILWGKQIPALPDEFRRDDVTVKGCESVVWLVSEQHNDIWQFYADSDARIVKGLIAVVLAAVNGKTTEQVVAFDINSYFEQLHLLQHLSPSRGNGLKAIVDTIYEEIKK